MMLSLLDDFYYLSILLHFCQQFFNESLSTQLIFSIRHHFHISKASNRQTFTFVTVHVSAAYSATFHTKQFIILFFISEFSLLVNNLHLSIKALQS